MKTAVLFPGQGAQYPGMGYDLYGCYPEARLVFERSAAVLGADFVETIFSGSEDKLGQTAYTQPAILTVSYAIYRVLEKRGLTAGGLAGLSLGEYSALVAAGSIDFDEALPLVRSRGLYMQEAVPAGQGMMCALMGLHHEQVERICRDASSLGPVSPANYNCPGQIVVSGQIAAVEKAIELARSSGAKKITPLKVSAPFHCALMQPVEARLRDDLDRLEIHSPLIPVVFNVSARFESDPDRIKTALVRQVSSPILWEMSVRSLMQSGITRFIGVGPGTSLSRLMKRIAPGVETISVENAAALKRLF